MAAERHYFVINQEGRSAHRRGPFTSAAAAREWADRFYRFPCWIIAADYAGAMEHRPMSGKGEAVQPEGAPAEKPQPATQQRKA